MFDNENTKGRDMCTDTVEATRKIGENRGKPRLWIEGQILLDVGFDHGDVWQLVKISDVWHILRGDSEPNARVRKIAGTEQRPIVDMSGATVAGCLTIYKES